MANIISSSDPDAGIRVAITPSQSAYFAGEPFSVTITFTNTRNAEAGPSKPSAYGHKRGAHSISSAPLSRPPTSPGTPRIAPVAPLVARAKSNTEAPVRKGLVGKSADELALEQRRKRLQGKSLSVSISPADVDAELSHTPSASAGPHHRTFQDSATFHRSPLVPSTLPRTDTLPLSRNHPHARKESVVDLPEAPSVYPPAMTPYSSTSSFSYGLDPITEASMGARSSYPSTPILAAPSIEPASPSRFNPIYGHPPSSSATSSSSSLSHSRIGLGHPSSATHHPYRHGLQPPRSAFSGSFPQIHQPNSEVILYSYAQLTGSVVITPPPGANLSPEQIQNLQHIRASLLKKKVVGGGSMDINSSLLSHASSGDGNFTSPTSVAGRQMSMSMKGHGRSSSITGALFSMLSPSSLVSTFSGSPDNLSSPLPSSGAAGSEQGRWRSSSSASNSSASTAWSEHGQEHKSPGIPGASSGLGLGLGLPTGNRDSGIITHSRSRRGSNPPTATHARRSSVAWIFGGSDQGPAPGSGSGSANNASSDEDAPLPTFEVQPAMLAVDLVLAPGESRSYTYTVNLPDNLPPTFRGKALRFSYELVVGLCRAGHSDTLAPPGTPLSAEHGGGSANVSKVMKVPIRMYNNVVVDHPPKPYNLLWPVDKRMDLAMPSSQAKVIENDLSQHPKPIATIRSPSTSKKGKEKEGLEEFLKYTARLLDSLPPPQPPPSPQQKTDNGEGSELGAANGDEAESPTTPSPPRRDTPAPDEIPPEPQLEPITPTSSSTPSDMSLSSSRSASPHPSPESPPNQEAKPRIERESSPPSPDAPQAPPVLNDRPTHRKPPMLDLGLDNSRRTSLELGAESSKSSIVTHEDGDGEGLVGGGCREAVEILTRTQKKASYDVTKDGVKVAVLTFPKSSYRLGETISGVVEINERKGRARVVQLAAFLEAHESLPSSLLPPSANRHLKRTYTEHYSSYLLNTLRTTFALDIPSDASPAFQTCVGTPKAGPNSAYPQLTSIVDLAERTAAPGGTTSFGGIEWKVRFCLLVAVAGEDTDTGTEGVRFKSLIRAAPRGEWGSSWKASPIACPLEKPKPPPKRKSRPASLRSGPGGSANVSQRSSMDSSAPSVSSARSTSWTAFFASYLSPSTEREYHDGDELGDEDFDSNSSERGGAQRLFGGSITSALLEEDDQDDQEDLDSGYDGIKPNLAGGVGKGVDFGGGDDGWRNAKLEMVECEVPVRVWPGNTAFKAMDVVFEV